jgi:hypothetical protein
MKKFQTLTSLKMMKILTFVLVFCVSSIAFAKGLGSADIFITTTNLNYVVSNVNIHRIAADDSNKLLCQTPHWFLNFYWAPKEWDVRMNVEKTDNGEFKTTVKPNYQQNTICRSKLITALDITMHDIVLDKDFSFGQYLYTDGDETIMYRAVVTYGQADWEDAPSYKVQFEEVDRYKGDDKNSIYVEIVDGVNPAE